MNKISYVNKLLASFNKKYTALANKLYDEILKQLDLGKSPKQAVSIAFKKYNVEQFMLTETVDNAVKSAVAGLDLKPSFSVRTNKGITSKVLAQSYDGSKTLYSKRLHGSVVQMQNKVTSALKQSINDTSAIKSTATKLFDGYGYGQKINTVDINTALDALSKKRVAGEPLSDELKGSIKGLRKYVDKLQTKPLKTAYNNVLDKLELDKFTEKAIQKSVYVALQEKSRYQANMIARTEAARAYYKAFESKAVLDPDVSGIKVSLSSSHKIFDICDVHANIDLGFGAGVYPLSKIPEYPLHPHCMCQLTEVYLNKIPEDAKVSNNQVDKSVKEYIDSLSEQEAIKLFGIDGYADYVESGKWDSLRNYGGLRKAKSVLTEDDFK